VAADAALAVSPSAVPDRWPAAAQQATSRAARSSGATLAAAASSSRGASRTGGSLAGRALVPVPCLGPLAALPPACAAFWEPVPPVPPSPVAAGGAAAPRSVRAFRREVATPAPYDVGGVTAAGAR